MAETTIVTVTGRKQQDDFIRVADRIYKDCPQYVPDFRKDLRDMLSQRRQEELAACQLQAFVAYQGDEPVGRIIGIVNNKANLRWNTHNVRFAMLEFIDDPQVSKALLDAVAQWGRSQGMDHLQGPMGITDFDKEGMLVEDFELSGSMADIYNPPYYARHMESYGLTKEVDWLQIRINIPTEVPARYARTAQYVREQMGLHIRTLTMREIWRGHYDQKVFRLLNEAYKPIFGFSELSEKQVEGFVKKFLPIIDLALIPIVENEQHEVVGVAVTMASLTDALKKSHGRLWPIGWLHLLRAIKWKHEDHADMLLVAVRPDYQGMGVNALFFDYLIPVYNRYGFKWAETGPQLEDNVRELSQWKPLHPDYVKRRRCYSKELTISN